MPDSFWMFLSFLEIHQRQPYLDDAVALSDRHAVSGEEFPSGLGMEPAGDGHDAFDRGRQSASGTFGSQHSHVHWRHIEKGGLVARCRVQNTFGETICTDDDSAADFQR